MKRIKLKHDARVTLKKIADLFEKAAKHFSELTNEERDAILKFHNEGASLNHCIRWGEQAASDLLVASMSNPFEVTNAASEVHHG